MATSTSKNRLRTAPGAFTIPPTNRVFRVFFDVVELVKSFTVTLEALWR